jgi:glycosyltransferase involved in cell wall biosynthesis
MKVNIITPIHPGGPYYAGKDLASILNMKSVSANWIRELNRVLLSPIYQNADIVHSCDVPIGIRLWKKPLVLVIHGEYPIEKTIWRPLYPRAIRMADIIITPSYFLKERLNLKQGYIIPNAIFPDLFPQISYESKKIINLLTITGFQFKDKAVSVLEILGILDDLPEEKRKIIKYSIVGGGRFLNSVIQESKKYRIDVEYLGYLSNPKTYLEKSDIFLYYSNHDNFPLVILEAMACGLPIISNQVGAIGEIIENEKNGFISVDKNSYSKILCDLINNLELRIQVGNQARVTVEKKFNWENVVCKYIDIYNKIL